MTTGGGLLVVLSVMLPAAGIVAMLALPWRAPERVALAVYPMGLAVAVAISWTVIATGAPLAVAVGGWAPPLGVMLSADGIAAVMLPVIALIAGLVGVAAAPALRSDDGGAGGRRRFVFPALLLGLWSALNLSVLARDLFTLFVALELLTFAAVPLVALETNAATLRAALRYLLFALAGSGLYLLGVALVYARHATLDIGLLQSRVTDADALALGLMTAGLMAKTAVFPLHLWLPPAHAGAPPPASAVLSALVVKAPFLLVARLWFGFGLNGEPAAATLIGVFGAASVLWCSVMALRQVRLKLMIAYSTVAQVGYLFLMIPLAPGAAYWTEPGWSGGMLQLVSHAFAKSAMFLAAGLLAGSVGHDRIDGLAGASRAAPLTVLALAIAGLSLVGLPPSGGFNAKAMLLVAAVDLGAWWIVATILAGGLIASAYVFRVIGRAMADADPERPPAPVARRHEIAPLVLALVALVLGLVPLGTFDMLAIGAGPGGGP